MTSKDLKPNLRKYLTLKHETAMFQEFKTQNMTHAGILSKQHDEFHVKGPVCNTLWKTDDATHTEYSVKGF